MSDAWFAGSDPVDRIREGTAEQPADWPRRAVETGFAADEATYYDRLHESTIAAAREAAAERERADDRQLAAAVRAMDDVDRTANELAERVAEWAGSLYGEDGAGIGYARKVAVREPDDPAERRVVTLARRVDDLASERDDLRGFVETQAPAIAPNLSEMAGPVLAARLIALAGGLESLAKKPAGTVQVLGAEDALFSHLAGRAPSPKHGVIFTHEFVRGTRPEDRGSAARAFAAKLALAARADYYSGQYRPRLHEDLADRMAQIRGRAE
jgi:nucleolar protein 56